MKRLLRKICSGFYSIVKHFPSSSSRFGGGISNFLRRLAIRGIVRKCGKGVTIEKNAEIPASLEIGDYSGIGRNCRINGQCYIGNYVMMGPDVLIFTRNHSHESTDVPMVKQGNEEEKPVMIESDVWIGARTIILPGVKIGTGSMIGAGSVVTKDVPPFSLTAGNPAKVISYRKQG